MHMDWREGMMHKIEKECGLACCCLVWAGSQNHQQDQTSGASEVEVEAGTRLHGQAVGASQQQWASRGKPMDSRYEGQMAGLVWRQALKQAWWHICSVLDSELELAEQENNENLLQAQAAALVKSGRSLEALRPKKPAELQANTLR